MKKHALRSGFAVFLFSICGVNHAAEKTPPDFSGYYRLVSEASTKADSTGSHVEILKLHHDGKILEISRLRDGQVTHDRYTIGSPEEDVKTPQRQIWKRRARFIKNVLEIEWKLQGSQGAGETRTKKRWELSADQTTLKIQEKTDMMVMVAVSGDNVAMNIVTVVDVYTRLEEQLPY